MRLLHAVAFFKKVTLVGSNQRNYIENENTCSKRTLKTHVATRLKQRLSNVTFVYSVLDILRFHILLERNRENNL